MDQLMPVEQQIVLFLGSEILVVKAIDGKLYVGIRWICEGIGLTEGQTKNERKKIQEDLVLKQGGRNFILPTNGGNQETQCIELDFLPLWLAKISITPSMTENNPEIAQKLVGYQLKAKDVLAQAFMPQQVNASSVEDLIIMQAQSMKEVKAQVATLQIAVKDSEETVSAIKETFLQRDEDWRQWINDMLNSAANRLGGGKERFQELRSKSYELLTIRAKCKLDVRLEWLKKRLFEAGAGKTKINNANKLDCIEEEPRLKEIYTTIVKELSIGSL